MASKGTGRARVQIVHLLMEGGGVILDQKTEKVSLKLNKRTTISFTNITI
jgi:ribosomal protein L4